MFQSRGIVWSGALLAALHLFACADEERAPKSPADAGAETSEEGSEGPTGGGQGQVEGGEGQEGGGAGTSGSDGGGGDFVLEGAEGLPVAGDPGAGPDAGTGEDGGAPPELPPGQCATDTACTAENFFCHEGVCRHFCDIPGNETFPKCVPECENDPFSQSCACALDPESTDCTGGVEERPWEEACLAAKDAQFACSVLMCCVDYCATGDEACINGCYGDPVANDSACSACMAALDQCIAGQGCTGADGIADTACVAAKCAGERRACFPGTEPAVIPEGECQGNTYCGHDGAGGTECRPFDRVNLNAAPGDLGGACQDIAGFSPCAGGLGCSAHGYCTVRCAPAAPPAAATGAAACPDFGACLAGCDPGTADCEHACGLNIPGCAECLRAHEMCLVFEKCYGSGGLLDTACGTAKCAAHADACFGKPEAGPGDFDAGVPDGGTGAGVAEPPCPAAPTNLGVHGQAAAKTGVALPVGTPVRVFLAACRDVNDPNCLVPLSGSAIMQARSNGEFCLTAPASPTLLYAVAWADTDGSGTGAPGDGDFVSHPLPLDFATSKASKTGLALELEAYASVYATVSGQIQLGTGITSGGSATIWVGLLECTLADILGNKCNGGNQVIASKTQGTLGAYSVKTETGVAGVLAAFADEDKSGLKTVTAGDLFGTFNSGAQTTVPAGGLTGATITLDTKF